MSAALPVVGVAGRGLPGVTGPDLRVLLEKVVVGEKEFEDVLGRSSWHANGFAKLVLRRTDDHAVRLHVWEGQDHGECCIVENIHDHLWSFSSLIVVGTLQKERFNVDPDGDPMDRYSYVRGQGQLPPGELHFTGHAGLALVQRMRRTSGTWYSTYDSVLHRTWADRGGMTATMVITGRSRSARRRPSTSLTVPGRDETGMRRPLARPNSPGL